MKTVSFETSIAALPEGVVLGDREENIGVPRVKPQLVDRAAVAHEVTEAGHAGRTEQADDAPGPRHSQQWSLRAEAYSGGHMVRKKGKKGKKCMISLYFCNLE